MKKIFIIFFSLFLFFNFFYQPAYAEDRFAACDACGYCPPNNPPGDWKKCQECIYPDASSDPATKDTLRVNPDTNSGPTPYLGRQYSMLGCIKTDLNSFQNDGASTNVIQVLLNIIFSVVGGIGLIYIIYGSFVILTSQANPERLNYGKRLVYGAIIGVIFSLSSVLIINFIGSGILKIPGFN